MSTPEPRINIPAADAATGLPIVIGMPFPQGTVAYAGALAVVSPGGVACPAAVRALNSWPDG